MKRETKKQIVNEIIKMLNETNNICLLYKNKKHESRVTISDFVQFDIFEEGIRIYYEGILLLYINAHHGYEGKPNFYEDILEAYNKAEDRLRNKLILDFLGVKED